MNNEQIRPVSYQQRFAIGLGIVAVFLFVALVIGLLIPGGSVLLVLRNILASIAILAGLLCLLVYVARQVGWRLPTMLQIPEDEQDQNWRLLALSLAIIILPLVMLLIQHVLFHQ
jgi:hypothetical protein